MFYQLNKFITVKENGTGSHTQYFMLKLTIFFMQCISPVGILQYPKIMTKLLKLGLRIWTICFLTFVGSH